MKKKTECIRFTMTDRDPYHPASPITDYSDQFLIIGKFCASFDSVRFHEIYPVLRLFNEIIIIILFPSVNKI